MNFPLSSVQKPKVGTCPHGLPMGACPICNGGGGGGGSSKKYDKANGSSGEMSWAECFAVGQMMKAQQLAQQKKDVAMQAQLHAPVNIMGKLENMAQKIAGFAEKLTNFIQKSQASPTIMSKTLTLAAKLAIPVLNVLKNIPILVQKTISFVKEKLADITDKLNAVFGELKASTEKKISDRLKDFKKKAKSLFGIFEPQDIDDEDKKIEEAKRLFDLKTALHNIKERLTSKRDARAARDNRGTEL